MGEHLPHPDTRGGVGAQPAGGRVPRDSPSLLSPSVGNLSWGWGRCMERCHFLGMGTQPGLLAELQGPHPQL